jgi:hypothetical protein
MASLNDDFNELMERVRQGREFSHASPEPVYYLVFSPRDVLEVKRRMPAWSARLTHSGWRVHTFSVAQAVLEVFRASPLRRIWIAADRKAPLAWERTNGSLANALGGPGAHNPGGPAVNGPLLDRLAAKLAEIATEPKAILLVTDLEALHPYMRIGAIEGQLAGKFTVPTIILYPGVRTGKSRLKFLGFYPDDGNYRSVHVGGM